MRGVSNKHCFIFICLGHPDYKCTRSSVEPCDFKSCVNGTCHNKEADLTARCECDPGFMGSLCQYSIDDCTDQSCVNGDCVDGHMSTTCRCWPGFEGKINVYSKIGLKWPLKNSQNKGLNGKWWLMKVKSIAECSTWSILQFHFDLH